jgi:hypothetical protein
MRVHYLLPFAYLIPALAFVARVHQVDRGEHGLRLPRDLENETASNTTIANVNETSNVTATQTSNSTIPSATTVPTLNTSTPDEGEQPFLVDVSSLSLKSARRCCRIIRTGRTTYPTCRNACARCWRIYPAGYWCYSGIYWSAESMVTHSVLFCFKALSYRT